MRCAKCQESAESTLASACRTHPRKHVDGRTLTCDDYRGGEDVLLDTRR